MRQPTCGARIAPGGHRVTICVGADPGGTWPSGRRGFECRHSCRLSTAHHVGRSPCRGSGGRHQQLQDHLPEITYVLGQALSLTRSSFVKMLAARLIPPEPGDANKCRLHQRRSGCPRGATPGRSKSSEHLDRHPTRCVGGFGPRPLEARADLDPAADQITRKVLAGCGERRDGRDATNFARWVGARRAAMPCAS